MWESESVQRYSDADAGNESQGKGKPSTTAEPRLARELVDWLSLRLGFAHRSAGRWATLTDAELMVRIGIGGGMRHRAPPLHVLVGAIARLPALSVSHQMPPND
jgi:hypothetical protein